MINSSHKTVLITGAAGNLAGLLIKKIISENFYRVIAVDTRPINLDCEHYQLDLRRKSALEILKQKKPNIIIHLGVARNPHKHWQKRENIYFFNLDTTSQLLNLAKEVNCEKLIFVSSANMYGPSYATCGFLTEDAPLQGASKAPEFRDLVTIDMMMQSFFWKQPSTKTIIFRPCHIVGKHLQNAPTRYLSLETIPYILGFDPIMQLMHEKDMLKALMLALNSQAWGIFNLAGKDTAPLSMILQALNRKTIGLPQTLLKALMTTTFFSKKSSFPASELEHLKYSCLVDTTRACEILGFKPQHGIASIVKNISF